MNRTTYRRARLVDDENADILGMPLQLAILVLVAGLALAAIIAWFGLRPADVSTIEVQYDGAEVTLVPEGTVDLTISVWDAKKKPLTGVRLAASNCGAQWSNNDDLIVTDAENFQTTLTTNFPGSSCDVTITAEKSGLGGLVTFKLLVNGD
jgi:hypothetical protein